MTPERLNLHALVTGATGFVGSHLVRRLLTEGWRVRLLVRRSTVDCAGGCEVVRGDLDDAEALRSAVDGVDVIFHCAANVATWDSWAAYQRVNVRGVANLLEAVASGNGGVRRIVHLSSVDVYGFPRHPAGESSELDGRGFGYGESKLRGEALLRERCRQLGVPFTIFRPANIIGPGSPFVRRIGLALLRGVMLEIDHGDANAGFLYIDNLVAALIWAARADKAIGETYNIRDDRDVSWHEFLISLRREIGGRGKIVSLPFSSAWALATACEKLCGLWPGREPPLHRLLINIFGRTCGHSADRLVAHGGMFCSVGFDEAMRHSAQWFGEFVSPR